MLVDGTRRCPECGRSVEDHSFPRADRPLHWRIIVPASVAILMLATVIVWALRQSQTLISSSGVPRTYLIEPAIRIANLKQFANGDPAVSLAIIESIRMLPNWDKDSPCGLYVFAGNFKPETDRNTRSALGWPTPWITTSTRAVYEDALNGTGLRQLVTDRSFSVLAGANASSAQGGNPPPRPRWSFNRNNNYSLAYRPPVEETGGKEVWIDYSLWAMGSAVGLLFLAWFAASIVIWLINVTVARTRQLRARRFKWCAVLLTAVLIGISAARSYQQKSNVTQFEFGKQVNIPNGGVYQEKTSVRNTGITIAELDEFARESAGDADMSRRFNVEVAQKLLAAIPNADDDKFLGIELTSECVTRGSMTGNLGWLRLASYSEHHYVRRPDFGQSEFVLTPKSRSFTIEHGLAMYKVSSGERNAPIRRWTIMLNGVGTLALFVTLVWLTAHLICTAVARFTYARRRRNGQCMACGYIVNPQMSS